MPEKQRIWVIASACLIGFAATAAFAVLLVRSGNPWDEQRGWFLLVMLAIVAVFPFRRSLLCKRSLFKFVTAVSLLLCVASAALWVRSRDHTDTAYRMKIPVTWSVSSTSGALTVGRREISGLAAQTVGPWCLHTGSAMRLPFGMVHWSFLSFSRSSFAGYDPNTISPFHWQDDYFTTPYWFLLIVTGVTPAWFAYRISMARRERHRLRRGRCPACDYDLRATPDRCPECGAAPSLPNL